MANKFLHEKSVRARLVPAFTELYLVGLNTHKCLSKRFELDRCIPTKVCCNPVRCDTKRRQVHLAGIGDI